MDIQEMPTRDVNTASLREEGFHYHRLEREPQFTELQFKQRDTPVPIKAILIAACMFLIGAILIVVGVLLFTGHFDAQYHDRMWPIFAVGAILFLPGLYHVRLAYYAWKKYDGYSFEDIPNDDD